MAGPFLEFNVYYDVNLGFMEVALAISLILFGILVIQAYNYFQNFDDWLPMKVLVTVVSVLEVFHTVVITHTIYYITITLAGRTKVGPNSYPLTTGIVLETLITGLVQGFFSFRIYRLSGKPYISIICWTLSLLRLGGGLALAAESYMNVPKQSNAFVLTDSYGWLITLALSVGAFVDVLIALSLCYYIKRLAPTTPSQSAGTLIDRVVTWTIQTGIITSMASVAVIITFQTIRKTEIWFSIYTILAKLYSNSFFVSLNVRQRNDEVPPTLSGLVFTSHLHPGFAVGITSGASNRTSDSFGSPSYPALTLPEKAMNSNTSFRRAIDLDLEARGLQ